MIYIYQIGDVVVNSRKTDDLNEEYKTNTKRVSLLWSPHAVWGSVRFVPEGGSYNIDLVLEDDDSASSEQKLQRLYNIAGFQTEVFGYFLDSCCGCQPIWVTNYGAVRSIKADSQIGANYIMASVTLEIGPYWSPVNRLLWVWQNSRFDPIFSNPYDDQAAVSAVTMYPDCDSVLKSCSYWWNKRPLKNTNIMFNPNNWKGVFAFPGSGYPQFGLYSIWKTNRSLDHYVFADEAVWGAPLSSVYVFRQVHNVSQIDIRVSSDRGLRVSTINLTETNARLVANSLPALNASDVIVVGDVFSLPGFILRNNQRIPNVFPIVTYPDWWPGMVLPGSVRVEFSLGSAEGAYIHLFRRL